MTAIPFDQWVRDELGISGEVYASLHIGPALDVFVSRIEAAVARGAENPLRTVAPKLAGGNSRSCTRRMLEQLGLTNAQRRTLHRLLAGSPSGWPGLLPIFVSARGLTERERAYARRQVRQLTIATTGRVAAQAPNDR